MAKTQIFLALCVASVAVAAPQLNIPGRKTVTTTTTKSDLDQNEVVTTVITSLQPAIAEAVAAALASLTTTTTVVTQEEIAAQEAAAAAAAADRAAAAAAAQAAADKAAFEAELQAGGIAVDPLATRAVYNYEYKVSDEPEQTFISQSESRDGEEVVGTYSYVDANGDLVTVNYLAGPMGYTETRDIQAGVVDPSQRPVRKYVESSGTSSSSSSSSS